MNVILYTNNSEKNKIGKALANETSLTGTLRTPSEIVNPEITIDFSNRLEFSKLGLNYAYIPEFGRFYFIKEGRLVSNKLCLLKMHVDVLESFSTEILNQYAVISRQENDWNLFLNDGFFRCYQNPQVQTKKFPNGFSSPDTYSWFLVTTAG